MPNDTLKAGCSMTSLPTTRYRLVIFDFDGTLADSLPWFRASFDDMVARFNLSPVPAEEMEGLRGMSASEIMARLNVSMWQLPAIVSENATRVSAAVCHPLNR